MINQSLLKINQHELNNEKKPETENGKIISYVIDEKSFINNLMSAGLDKKTVEILLSAVSEYVIKTNYSKILCESVKVNKHHKMYLLNIYCEKKDENSEKVRGFSKIWKIAKSDMILDELEKFDSIKNSASEIYLNISDTLDKKNKINYYFNLISENPYNKKPKSEYLIIEYENKNNGVKLNDCLSFSTYLKNSVGNITKASTSVLDMVIDEEFNSINENRLFNHVYNDIISDIFSKEKGLASIYNIKKRSINKDKIQKIIGYYPPAETVINDAQIFTEEEKSNDKKVEDSNGENNSNGDYKALLKSEVWLTLSLNSDDWYQNNYDNDSFSLIDIEGKRYDLKFNSSIEKNIAFKKIKRLIKKHQKNNYNEINLVLEGIESGRKHTELSKILTGLNFDEKEREKFNILSRENFIDAYTKLIEKELSFTPYFAKTKHNIDPDNLLIEKSGKHKFIYDYLKLREGDIASDFTRLELLLKLNYMTSLSFDSDYTSEPAKMLYSFNDKAKALLDIEDYLSSDDSSTLFSPIVKDKKFQQLLKLSVFIRKSYFEVVGKDRNKINLIKQYYYSLLANSILILKELFDEYYSHNNRDENRRDISELNEKRKWMYYQASYYLNLVSMIEYGEEESTDDEESETLTLLDLFIERIESLSNKFVEQTTAFTSYNYNDDLFSSGNFSLAFELMQKGRYDESLAYLASLSDEDIDKDRRLYTLMYADACFYRQDFDASVKTYEDILRISDENQPIYIFALYGLANSYYYSGKHRDSLDVYNKVLKYIDSNDNLKEISNDMFFQSVMRKIGALLKINRTLDALNFLENVLSEDNSNTRAKKLTPDKLNRVKMLLAEANRLRGNYNEAISIYSELVQNDIECIPALNGLGLSYLMNKEHIKSRDAFEASLFVNKDPYTNYTAYKGLREALLLNSELSTENSLYDYTQKNGKNYFQQAYNYGVVLESINQKYNLPRIFSYSPSNTDDNDKQPLLKRALREDDIKPNWLKTIAEVDFDGGKIPANLVRIKNGKADKDYKSKYQEYFSKITNNAEEKLIKSYDKQPAYPKRKEYVSPDIVAPKTIRKNHRNEADNGENAQIKYWLSNADTLYKREKYKEAITLLDKILDKQANHIEALYKKANCYFRLNKYRKAIGLYHKVYEADSSYQTAITNIGVCYNKLGEYNHAIRIFELVLRSNSDNETARFNQAISLIGLKKYNQANTILEQINIHNSNIDSIKYKISFYKGLTYYMMGDILNEKHYSDAVREFNDSIRINPNFSLSHTYLAKAKQKLAEQEPSKIKGSFKNMSKALDIEKDEGKFNDETFISIGNLLLKTKDVEHARMSFEKALRVNKDNLYAYVGLGDCSFLEQDYENAVYYYDDVLYRIDDKLSSENKLIKKLTLQRKIRASYHNNNYFDCVSEINRLEHFTGALSDEFLKIRKDSLSKVKKHTSKAA